MIKTDFSKVDRLLLIYPVQLHEDRSDHRTLEDFYDEFIAMVPTSIHVTVLGKSRSFADRIRTLRAGLDCIICKELSTIWLRDVAGFNCGDRIVKPFFRPQYYRGAMKRAGKINRSMEVIHEILDKEIEKISLVWDGGNLVTNGKIGIITERILKDNPQFTGDRIAHMIREALHIEPVFIPELPGDVLAHSDGYLAFLDERTACVSRYPRAWHDADHKYVESLAEILQGHGIEVVRIMDCPQETRVKAHKTDIESAKGIYVNFLHLNDTFILPQYSLDSHLCEDDYNAANKSILGKYGEVRTINCDRLAELGEFFTVSVSRTE